MLLMRPHAGTSPACGVAQTVSLRRWFSVRLDSTGPLVLDACYADIRGIQADAITIVLLIRPHAGT